MKSTSRYWGWLALSTGVLILVMGLSLRFGADQMRTATVWHALTTHTLAILINKLSGTFVCPASLERR
ncbi:hypothetical protein RYX41_03640 [Lactiplantibacillus plantarum]|nr:hypothetical protein [Lactiplantibacillus plantarum]